MKVNTVILAGAPNKGLLKQHSKETHEALIKIDEIPMVEYVLQAVKNAQNTDNILVVGPESKLREINFHHKVDKLINSGDSMIDNIRRGIEAIPDQDKYILLLTADIPLITGDMIDEYIFSCSQEEEVDFYFPIIEKNICREKYPEIERTYVNLDNGIYTGGNIIVARPFVFLDTLDLLKKVIMWRKKPWKLSRLLGFKFIIKYFLGNLSLLEIEERISQIIGYRGKALKSYHPELGFDVDKPGDLKLIRERYIPQLD
ncbi:MAG: nucleotidyltransferase family protein [Bacillota bacterium]